MARIRGPSLLFVIYFVFLIPFLHTGTNIFFYWGAAIWLPLIVWTSVWKCGGNIASCSVCLPILCDMFQITSSFWYVVVHPLVWQEHSGLHWATVHVSHHPTLFLPWEQNTVIHHATNKGEILIRISWRWIVQSSSILIHGNKILLWAISEATWQLKHKHVNVKGRGISSSYPLYSMYL